MKEVFLIKIIEMTCRGGFFMKVLRCLLSMFLCSSLFFSNVTGFIAIAANGSSKPNVNYDEPNPNFMDDPCPFDKKNKKGEYIEPLCKETFFINSIKKKGVDSFDLLKGDNLGPEARHEVYVLPIKAIASLISAITNGLVQSKSNAISEDILRKCANKVKLTFGHDFEDSDTVIYELFKEITGSEILPGKIKTAVSTEKEHDSSIISRWSWGSAIAGGVLTTVLCVLGGAALVTGGVAVLASTAGAGGLASIVSSGVYESSHNEEAKNHRAKMNNYVSALHQILENLKYDFWKSSDTITMRFNNSPSDTSATVGFERIGLNYKPEEVKKIHQAFEDSKIKFQELIDKYDK